MGSRVMLIREERFLRSSDGRVWSRWGTGQHSWLPFLSVFDSISLVARIQEVQTPPPGATLASSDRVEMCPVSYFQGPWGYVRQYERVQRDLARWLEAGEPLVIRIPSPLANSVWGALRRTRRRFAVEVAADPHDQMSRGAMKHPLRPLFRWRYTDLQERLTRSARVVKYVTRQALQRRYPASSEAAVHAVSDAFLPPDSFQSRRCPPPGGPLQLVFVGMLEQLYKGPDVLLHAMASAKGKPMELKVIGDGHYRLLLERLASKLGIESKVRFVGAYDRRRIQEALDGSDLFVLPSRQEGLPRAMLEAMARSLPCLGTTVGGIPELLEPQFLVPPNDASALANKLVELEADRPGLIAAGERNLRIAREYGFEKRLSRETSFAADVQRLCS